VNARVSLVALKGVDALEVGEDDVPIEAVLVLGGGVFHDRVGDVILVVAGELGAAAGTGLRVGHIVSLAGRAKARWSELKETFNRHGRFGESQLAVVGVGLKGFEDAVAEVLVDEAEGDLLEGGVDGGDLGEDVDAVGVFVDQALQAADLAFDLAETGEVVVLLEGVATHVRSLRGAPSGR
jgi:hypothetical protein